VKLILGWTGGDRSEGRDPQAFAMVWPNQVFPVKGRQRLQGWGTCSLVLGFGFGDPGLADNN